MIQYLADNWAYFVLACGTCFFLTAVSKISLFAFALAGKPLASLASFVAMIGFMISTVATGVFAFIGIISCFVNR